MGRCRGGQAALVLVRARLMRGAPRLAPGRCAVSRELRRTAAIFSNRRDAHDSCAASRARQMRSVRDLRRTAAMYRTNARDSCDMLGHLLVISLPPSVMIVKQACVPDFYLQ